MAVHEILEMLEKIFSTLRMCFLIATDTLVLILLLEVYISVQFSSVTQSCPTLWDPWITAHQASLSITNSRSSLRLTSIKLMMPSSHLTLCRPLLLLPSIFPSIRVFFKWVRSSHQVAKVLWSFRFSISPSNEYSGLISFRIDWFDLLAVQGTLKSLSNTTV